MKVIPMGLAHAVLIIKRYHEGLIERLGVFRRSAKMREGGLTRRETKEKLGWSVIVDDLNLVGIGDPVAVDKAMAAAEPLYQKAYWAAKDSKREAASTTDRKVAGVMLEGKELVVRPPLRRLQDTMVVGVHLCRQEVVTVAAVDRVVHILGWYALLTRPALSIFSRTYLWLQDNRDRV